MRVVIVGAGLGGLAAGLALTRAGHEVTVLERAEKLRENGAGIGLMPNAVLALDALGFGEPVRAQAAPMSAGGLLDRHGRALLSTDQAALGALAGAPLVVVARAWLHRLLASALPAGTVRTGVAVRAVEPGPDGVLLRTDAGESLAADAVVVADGAGSRLRGALLPHHSGVEGSGELAARAIAPGIPAGTDIVSGELLDHRTGERTGCMPMADGRVYWYATWRESYVGPAPADPAALLHWLAARRADWHPSIAALIRATAPEGMYVDETARLVVPLPTLAVGRVALLGDAAHAMTPDLGQGGGQAFEDAVALGAVLTGVDAAGVPAALRRYDALRRPRTTDLQIAARRANRLLGLRGVPARLRDAALRLVPRAAATRALARQFRFDPVAR